MGLLEFSGGKNFDVNPADFALYPAVGTVIQFLGVFWAQQPMWFFYVQVTQGLLTLYAHLTRRLILKAATLALTFPALPWLSWVTEINLYGDITLTTEYKVFNQIFLILPYILVQIGYAYFILRTWVRARLAQKAELPVPATNNNFGA